MRNLYIAALALCVAGTTFAQTNDQPTLKVTPTGRALMDGAIYTSNDNDFKDGLAMPDLRLGVKATYGDWKAKVDVGFGYGKVSIKDVFIEKDFSKNLLLRVGNFVHQFGLQSATSSSMKISMEEPTSNEVFGYPRLLGAMVVYDKDQYFAAASVHGESYEMQYRSNEMGRPSYGGITRLVYRPSTADGKIMQIGISGAISTPQYDKSPARSHHVFNISGGFPTRVAKITAINADITDAQFMGKFTPELLLNSGPVALESQYYWFGVKRDAQPTYTAYGAYGLLRMLAKGGNYKYSHADAGIATPGAKSLEFVLGYNYTNLSNNKTGIQGGRISDLSLTANWYINKYIIWRWRASYTHSFDRANVPDVNLGALQTRLQIIF